LVRQQLDVRSERVREAATTSLTRGSRVGPRKASKPTNARATMSTETAIPAVASGATTTAAAPASTQESVCKRVGASANVRRAAPTPAAAPAGDAVALTRMAYAATVPPAAAAVPPGAAGTTGTAAAAHENAQVFPRIDGESAPDHAAAAAETRPAPAPTGQSKLTGTRTPTTTAAGFNRQGPCRWRNECLPGINCGEAEHALQAAFPGDTADRGVGRALAGTSVAAPAAMLHVGLQARHRDAAAIAERPPPGADAAAAPADLAAAPGAAVGVGAALALGDAPLAAALLAPRTGRRRRLAQAEQACHRAEKGAAERAPGARRGNEPGQTIKGRRIHDNLCVDGQEAECAPRCE
jgi:hypothetical protein